MPREIRFYNTLTRRAEVFTPLEAGHARIYTCGPTVYNFVHIGNLRTFLFEDVLRRTLKAFGYRVTQVMNLTDVDDKTIRGANAEGIAARVHRPLRRGVLRRHRHPAGRARRALPARHRLRAADGRAGPAPRPSAATPTSSTGSMYFRIASFPALRQALRRQARRGQVRGARRRRRVREGGRARLRAVEGAQGGGAGVGHGARRRPARLAHRVLRDVDGVLGESFDIHTGGVDNIFPHHENEIAQSEGATGKPFVRIWLHAEHLLVEGQKMAKSLGNFFTLRDLLERGHDPLAIRYLLISVPYRQKLNFTFDGLHGAGAAIERIANTLRRLAHTPAGRGRRGRSPRSTSRRSGRLRRRRSPTTSTPRGRWRRSTRCSPGSTRRWTPRASPATMRRRVDEARRPRRGRAQRRAAGRSGRRGRRDRRPDRRPHGGPDRPRLRPRRRDPRRARPRAASCSRTPRTGRCGTGGSRLGAWGLRPEGTRARGARLGLPTG